MNKETEVVLTWPSCVRPSPSPSPSSASMLPVTSTHVLVNEDNSCLFNTEACRPLPCLQENHCITRSGPLKAPCKRQHHYSRCRLRHEHLGSEGATLGNASRSQRYKCKRLTLRTPCLGLPLTPSHLRSPSSWMDFSHPDSSRCWLELHLNVTLQDRCFCASGSHLAWQTHRFQAAHQLRVSALTPATSTLNIRSENVSVQCLF